MERIILIDHKINGCLDVHYGESSGGILNNPFTMTNNTNSADTDDETDNILGNIVASDLTLFATPHFAGDFPLKPK